MSSRSTLFFIIPFVVTSIALLVVGTGAAWYVHHLNREVSNLLADNLECAIACEHLVSNIRDARTEIDRFMSTGDPSHLETAVAVQAHTVHALDDAERSAPNWQIREMLIHTRQSHDQFFAKFTVVTAGDSDDELMQQIAALSRSLDAELLAPAQEVLAYNQQALVQHGNRSRKVADQVGLGLFALGTCGAVAGLLSGFGVTGALTRQFEQREREALRAEQLAAIGQLAAGLAHELRNPLMSMKILVQTATEKRDGAALTARDLSVLLEEVERLEHLVNSFLDFARPPSLEKRTFDARGLIDQTIHLISGPAERLDVAIDYESDHRPLNIEADPVQFRQVLLNLLLNALDALPDGGNIRVETERQSDGHAQWLAIRVIDDGPGIPGDIRDRIFEPFFSTKETGTGLGLAIILQIIEAHGGTIEVDEKEGGGSIFTICLPIGATASEVTNGDQLSKTKV